MDVLVPCKGISTGKSRLRECLNSNARRDLCEWLLVNTLRAAGELVGPGRVHVVTLDENATSIARRHSMRQIADPGLGLNEALEFARAVLLSEGRCEMLVLPIDLPYLEAEALSNVRSCKGDVVIADDELGTGTNILFLRSAAVRTIPFAYGADSFAAHLSSARSLGMSSRSVKDWRLSFDIDEPMHYLQWREDSEHAPDIIREPRGSEFQALGLC